MAGTAALGLMLTGCGGSDSSSDEPQAAAPPEGLVAVPGYEYVESQGDPTATAVIAAYESMDVLPGPLVISEDFESGAGPFMTGADETASIEVTGGALRITNSSSEFSMDSYVDLDAPADSVHLTTAVTIAEPLQTEEGPALVISRWGPGEQEFELEYEFVIDGQTAMLWESKGPDDFRKLDSAAVPAGLTGEVEMGLWVYARGDSTFAEGWLAGERLVEKKGASGPFDTVALRVWSTGTPRVMDFEWAEVRAQAVGEDLPALFAQQAEHGVEQDGEQVATIVVLEPSQFMSSFGEYEYEQYLPVRILLEADPAGMTVDTATLAGQEVVQGTLDGITFWVWTHEELWYVTTAVNADAGTPFIEGFLSELHGAPQAQAAG